MFGQLSTPSLVAADLAALGKSVVQRRDALGSLQQEEAELSATIVRSDSDAEVTFT